MCQLSIFSQQTGKLKMFEDATNDTIDLITKSEPGPPMDDTEEDEEMAKTNTGTPIVELQWLLYRF